MTITRGARRIFKASVVNPVSSSRTERYDPGYLVILGDKIERLSRTNPAQDLLDAKLVSLEGRTIVPGFIDVHVHLPQYAIMGKGSGKLLSWLDSYTYPEEARFTDSEYAALISERFFNELLANGTTAAAIYSSVHEEAADIAFRTAQAKGVTAFIGKVMMDRNSPAALEETTEESIAASVRLFEKWDGAESGRLRYIFTPRFAGSCSMELMKRTGQLAKERHAFVQSHLSETTDEVRMIRELFPHSPSYTAVYDSAGLLHERSIMGHCVQLTSDEISLLFHRRVNVAFCPYSNRNLHSGTMPYQRLRQAGLNIALGTDIAGGPSLSMIRQMDEAQAAAGLNRDEALYLATLAGATALGLEDRIGSLDPGKDADFVVLQNDRVEEVYVRGRRVYFRKP